MSEPDPKRRDDPEADPPAEASDDVDDGGSATGSEDPEADTGLPPGGDDPMGGAAPSG